MDEVETISLACFFVATKSIFLPEAAIFFNALQAKDWKSYFPSPSHQFKVNQPFNVCGLDNSFDMSVNVYGGGITGQVEAIRLAISRALCEVDEKERESSFSNLYY